MNHFEQAHKAVCQLVKDFQTHEKKYLSSDYSEARARLDFIDKFFTALGWDVNHDTQKNPYEQEVTVEKGVNVARAQKRADYAFCIAPNFRDAKFFVEAKKPAKALTNPDDYFQTARYGWNANTPLAVLTDFEEFHIIDCRFKPAIGTALTQKLKKYHYSEYVDKEKFAEIYWLFSHEAVEGNSLEKHAETLKKPTGKAVQRGLFPGGYQPIDEAFLEEMDEIRKTLAKSFKRNAPHLYSEEITEAVQKTIDRLVFMRFLEDKLIEPEYILDNIGQTGNAWAEFISISRKLDKKYNGIVFKEISIDIPGFEGPVDAEFRDICENLSHQNTPYDFNYIPVHIIGSIYERFLGKVVHATAKRVDIEEKPEVRKAGGVYYTPQYIVRYIVENTIGKLIEGKTPEEIAKLRFADIACGSGSFLIGALELLLDYHHKYYQAHPDKAKKDGCYQKDGKWVLNIRQKQSILLNNIYGVDIDPQAIEVTQLSLALKMLEDETTATANDMQVLFHSAVLPDLTKNIVCGNSLIGTDILQGDLFELDKEEERKLKPMDYKSVFPGIMKNGGFDAIIGNPPYFSLSTLSNIVKDYFTNKYFNSNKTSDIYCLFFEKAINISKNGGLISYITSSQWLQTNYGKTLRNYFVNNANPILLINFGGNKIFKNATVDTTLIILKKEQCKHNLSATIFKSDYSVGSSLNKYFTKYSIKLNNLNRDKWIIEKDSVTDIRNKIKHVGALLRDKNNKINYGIKTGLNEAFIIDKTVKNKLCKEDKRSIELLRPILRGRDVHKYTYEWAELWLIVAKNGIEIKRYNAIYNHLKTFGKSIIDRSDKGENWWNLRACSYYDDFDKVKIIYPETTVRRSEFVMDRNNMFIDKTCFMITGDDLLFLNGILASKLIEWYLESELRLLGKKSIQYSKQFIENIPIPTINKVNNNNHDQINKLVVQMLDSKNQYAFAKTENDKYYYQQKCQSLDNQIDKLVYELYGLTEEEIKVVEG